MSSKATSAGATPKDWIHFDLVLGLGRNLLPLVPDPAARAAPGQRRNKSGGVYGPSHYNEDGLVIGLKDWQTRNIEPGDVIAWSKDPRLTLCVRTGQISGHYAIDFRMNDEAAANAMRQRLRQLLPRGKPLPERILANGAEFLVPIVLTGSHENRIIKTAHGLVNLLADGKWFVAAGSDSSGLSYQWRDGLPPLLPILTLEEFQSLWTTLESEFGIKPAGSSITSSAQATADDQLLTYIGRRTLNDLRSALLHRSLRDLARDDKRWWSAIGHALLSLGEFGYQLFSEFSRMASDNTQETVKSFWESNKTQTLRYDYRFIFKTAHAMHWRGTLSLEELTSVQKRKPFIRIEGGKLETYARQAEQILNLELFVRGNKLVRLGEASEVDDNIRRAQASRVLIPVTPEYIQRRLTALAEIETVSKAGKVSFVSCPSDLARNILGQGSWPHLRALNAIVRAPFVRPDGSICDVPGYDHASQVFAVHNGEFLSLPKLVSRDDALAARDLLMYPFSEFPYTSATARSAFLAHILTEVSRTAVDRSPIFWYSAQYSGTGKSLLSELPATIAHGTEPALRPWLDDAAELRKTLFASLLAGDRSIAFDNLPSGHKIRSATLCAFLTSKIWQDRKLGVSEAPSLLNNAVVSASGNNVTPAGDLSRRSIVIRLDANVPIEVLRQREFRIKDLRSYVLKHRVELLIAALTIIRGHEQSHKLSSRPMQSFEKWSQTVADAIAWLGMADPLETQDLETDDEQNTCFEVFRLLGELLKQEFTAEYLSNFIGMNEALHEAIRVAGYELSKIQYFLRANRDKILAGYKLVRLTGSKSNSVKTKWRFVGVGEESWQDFRARNSSNPHLDLI